MKHLGEVFLLKLLLANGIPENVEGDSCLQFMWQKEKLTLHSTIHFALPTQPVNIREYLKVSRRSAKGTIVLVRGMD